MEQQTLFEPSEGDLINRAMARPLKEKIKDAVGLFQLYEHEALRLSKDGYWLAYSGGKDSDVILELAKMAGVKYKPVYNVTTIDPPELVRYIKDFHPEVVFSRPKTSMLKKVTELNYGPPTRLMRWCCALYKESSGNGLNTVIGVRAAESPRRKKMWSSVVQNRQGGTFICPIVYWTDDDVWNFHKDTNITHCKLYDEGFKRLGCIGCPMGGEKQRDMQFKRWPRYEKLWKLAFERFWNNWHGVPKKNGEPRWFEDFGSAEGLWKWWKSGKTKTDASEECQFDFMQT